MKERAIAAQTITTASPAESSIALSGRSVSARAADAGPTIRLKTSSVPTTGTAIAVASATTPRNRTSIRRAETPIVSAISGETELRSSGRNSTTTSAIETELSANNGQRSALLTPRISPNRSA